MSIETLPSTPPQAAKNILRILPAKRMREVLERRFGLKGGGPETLEEIGGSYKITRERVRQIEADALRRLRAAAVGQLDDFLLPISSEAKRRGEVIAENDLFSLFAPKRWYPHLRLLLTVSPQFHFIPESGEHHPHWALDPASASNVKEILGRTVARVSEKGEPVDKTTLYRFISLEQGNTPGASLQRPDAPDVDDIAGTRLGISKLIAANPYGEYGLISWPTIIPRGIKDKAHLVLAKTAKPLHFREVAAEIDKVGWGNRKKAHPQTVHNELIKDGRFVLVGRGLYALREWGYEPGTVREVLASLLKSSREPLDREEIIRRAIAKRVVKPQTILLNLQDRTLFKRTEDGRYTLV